LAWEKQFTFLPDYNTTTISYTALATTSYIITGNARNLDGTGGSIGFIKAYDVATGNIKWEKTLTLGANVNGFGSIVINGDLALVRGNSLSISGSPPVATLVKGFIRAYQVDTGVLVWEVVRDFEATAVPGPIGLPTTQTGNNRVFTFFMTINPDGTPNYDTVIVRAYQVRNVYVQSALLLD
jgi:glucose dehydrogenase